MSEEEQEDGDGQGQYEELCAERPGYFGRGERVERTQKLAQLGERVLEILREPQQSESYRTLNRARDMDLVEIWAKSLGLLEEEKKP